MAKTVFRPNEIKSQKGEVMLKLVHEFKPPEEKKVEAAPEYDGPTVDDLRREAEEYKKNWEAEKQRMLDEAQASADEIVRKAEQAAFAEVKRQTDEANIIKADAQKNAEEIVKKAQEAAQGLIRDAEAQQQKVESDAHKKGFDEGHESGYRDGEAEANRLIERMHSMLEAVMHRREEILRDTETQIVELVILMTRKVVKIISENQKSVIMSNVLAALKKVKGRCEVTLRVNLEDVKLTTEHIDDFIKRVENIRGITVVEDSTVEKGGCIVETDFGAIDARISSQLSELENRVMEISPVKTLAKSDVIEPSS
ncbi:flagellar assembly protein FliH [Treponema sp. Marseille-Q4523]|uniref:flagellar assembly protein FliH n=1 Tax=Treponema TaxID=157 RepID=UPI00196048C7|nr:flagellar assembly protein FliH [Treponema sp. Marseille-Q4523]MBM7023422.1 flagellar assembly protein FliH [Treponema sp. Marseille-Q4523]